MKLVMQHYTEPSAEFCLVSVVWHWYYQFYIASSSSKVRNHDQVLYSMRLLTFYDHGHLPIWEGDRLVKVLENILPLLRARMA